MIIVANATLSNTGLFLLDISWQTLDAQAGCGVVGAAVSGYAYKVLEDITWVTGGGHTKST